MYKNGKGVPQNYLKAIELYAKAADQGHASAQYNLGLMYKNSEETAQMDVILIIIRVDLSYRESFIDNDLCTCIRISSWNNTNEYNLEDCAYYECFGKVVQS